MEKGEGDNSGKVMGDLQSCDGAVISPKNKLVEAGAGIDSNDPMVDKESSTKGGAGDEGMTFDPSSKDEEYTDDVFDKAKTKVIRWPDFRPTILEELWAQLTDETLVDCTLVCSPTESISVHRIILSANSPYFKSILSCTQSASPHPIVILQDVDFKVLKDLVTFMYRGEVKVNSGEMDILMKTADNLQIHGLTQLSTPSGVTSQRSSSSRSRGSDPTVKLIPEEEGVGQGVHKNRYHTSQFNHRPEGDPIPTKRPHRALGSADFDPEEDGTATKKFAQHLPSSHQLPADIAVKEEFSSVDIERRSWPHRPLALVNHRGHHRSGPDVEDDNSPDSPPSDIVYNLSMSASAPATPTPLSTPLAGGHGGSHHHHHHHHVTNPTTVYSKKSRILFNSGSNSNSSSSSHIVPGAGIIGGGGGGGGVADGGLLQKFNTSSRWGRDFENHGHSASSELIVQKTTSGFKRGEERTSHYGSSKTASSQGGPPRGEDMILGLPTEGTSASSGSHQHQQKSMNEGDCDNSNKPPPDCDNSMADFSWSAAANAEEGSRSRKSSAASSSGSGGGHGSQGHTAEGSILCLRYCCIYCSQNFPSQSILGRHIVSFHHQIHNSVGAGPFYSTASSSTTTPSSGVSSLQLRSLKVSSGEYERSGDFSLQGCKSNSPTESSSKLGRHHSFDSSTSTSKGTRVKVEPSPGPSDYETSEDPNDETSNQLPSPPPGGPSTSTSSPPSEILCKFCSKPFPEVSLLIQHLPIHTGERPFKCEYCGKAFKLRHHMKDHARVHTGERPFKCQLCGKTFSRSTILKAHEKTHFPKT